MTGLTVSDPHYWAPVPQVVQWLCDRLPEDAKVLELGASHVQFPRASMFVDFQDVPGIPPDRLVKCDLSSEKLPFPDKSFDFCYSRHMLEDMHNPFPACAEMSRVAKAGYIETPSPIAELCRGVDGGAPAYRGYHHHRYMLWEHEGQLRAIAKYPLIEYLQLDEAALASLLRAGPAYWNTYHLWEDRVDVKHIQNALDYDMMRDYAALLLDALRQSKAATDEFLVRVMPAPRSMPTVPDLGRAYV